jgi:hypothetical protein
MNADNPAMAWHNGICRIPFKDDELMLLLEALNGLKETKLKALAILKAEGGRFAELTSSEFAVPEIDSLTARVEAYYQAEPEED